MRSTFSAKESYKNLTREYIYNRHINLCFPYKYQLYNFINNKMSNLYLD